MMGIEAIAEQRRLRHIEEKNELPTKNRGVHEASRQNAKYYSHPRYFVVSAGALVSVLCDL